MDEIALQIEYLKRNSTVFEEHKRNIDWEALEKKLREDAKYSAIYCRNCGGVETAYYEDREINVYEAFLRGFIAVDAGCIC